tara:strand:+ start:415 stop:603 length:189 start_codon:yes stop_codon:yes gene_type:complete
MHPMIGKTFSVKIDGVLRVYEIVEIDTEGWIKLLRQDNNKHIYFQEDIHRNLLNKLGYRRQK